MLFFDLDGLNRRIRSPAYWAAFAVIYCPNLILNFWEAFQEGLPGNSFHWAYNVITPFIYLTGIVWLSPIPWENRKGRKLVARQLILRGALFSECFMIALVLLDAEFRKWSGAPIPLRGVLLSHIAFHAPAMMLVGAVLAARERLTRVNEDLKALASDAQARALQGQLHPHVLFNALNGLAELIHKKSDQAEEGVRHLSDLLRKVLRATDDPGYTLGKERSLLEDYLQMEGLRLGKRLRLSWDWDPALEGMGLPPLLLQPLVENAIKHGVAPSRKGGDVIILARQAGCQVVLGVRNTGKPLAYRPEDRPSVGLLNLQSRLELAFGGSAHFSLRSEGGWVVAEIRLPWVALPEPGREHERVESGRSGRRASGSGTYIALS